jgi:hypothetical protein
MKQMFNELERVTGLSATQIQVMAFVIIVLLLAVGAGWPSDAAGWGGG